MSQEKATRLSQRIAYMAKPTENWQVFLENFSWHFQSGKNILIGEDCFMSGSEVIEIQMHSLNFLHRHGIFYWESHIAKWNGPIPQWKEAKHMQMPTNIASQWDKIKLRL